MKYSVPMTVIVGGMIVILIACGTTNSDDEKKVTDPEEIGACEQSGRYGNDPLRYPEAQDMEVYLKVCRSGAVRKTCSGEDQLFKPDGCDLKGVTGICRYIREGSKINYHFYTKDADSLKKIATICKEADGLFELTP